MAQLTDQLSTPKNQIQVREQGVTNSAAAIVGGLSALVSPLVASYKEAQDTKKLTVIEQGLEDEYVRLSDAYKQGTIKSSGEFFRRLNAKVRSYEADYPSIADNIRQRVNQEFGGMPGQMGFDATVDPMRIEEQAKDNTFKEAMSYGIEIRDAEGRVDKDATTNMMMQFKAEEFKARFKDPAATKAEASSRLYQSLSERRSILMTSLDSKINTLTADATLTDAQKLAGTQQMVNQARLQWMNQVVIPETDTSGGDLDDIKKIKDQQDAYFTAKLELLTDEKFGTMRDRSRIVKEVTTSMGLDLEESAPWLTAMADKFGSDAVAPLIANVSLYKPTEGGASLGSQLKTKVGAAVTKMMQVNTVNGALDGSVDTGSLAVGDKKAVAGILTGTVKQMAEKPLTQDSSKATYVKACGEICKLAGTSMRDSDKEYVMDLFANKPAGVQLMKLRGPQARDTAIQMRDLGMGYIMDNFNKSDVPLQYNPSVGRFSPTQGAKSSDLAKIIKLNNALTTSTKAVTLLGGSHKEAEVKQYLIDSLGLPTDPNYTKPIVSGELDNVFNETKKVDENQGSWIDLDYDPTTGKVSPRKGK